jgi:hypothetical protein
MVTVSRLFDWRMSLVVVKPDTFIHWHRKSFRLALEVQVNGRTRLPKDLRELIRRMAAQNPSWGQERITKDLKLKLGIRVSPSTVASYLRAGPGLEAGSEATMDDLRSQSCQSDRGMRLLRSRDSQLPHPLCVRNHGTGYPQDPPP